MGEIQDAIYCCFTCCALMEGVQTFIGWKGEEREELIGTR
jgi:hypothetical protein